MPILSGGPLYRDKTKAIEDYPASSGEVFGAAFQRAIDTGITDVFARGTEAFIGQAAAKADPARYAVRGADAKAEAAKRNVALDLDDDAELSRPELDTMLRLKERERKQLQTMGRRPQTWGGFAVELSGGLAGSLADPAQAAASFIPVVGQARYARYLAGAKTGLGRAGVRAGVGAVEGLAGAALLEPLVYTRAQSLGLEYTTTDSFMNLAFGTVLGGGLHVMGGAALDAVSPARRAAIDAPDVKARAALAEAVTALDEGRAFDASPVFQDGRGTTAVNDAPTARSAPDDLSVYGDRVFYRGVKPDREEVISVSDRGPLGAGVYLSGQDGVARMYGEKVIVVRVKGEIFNGLARWAEGNAIVQALKNRIAPFLNEKETARFAYMSENRTEPGDIIDSLSRSLEPERLREVMQRAGYAGIEANVDGHELVVFDPANIIKEDDYQRALRDRSAPTKEPAIMPDTYDPVSGYEPPEMERVRVEADEAVMRAEDDIDGEIEALNELLGMAEKREPLSEADRAALELADAFEANAARSANSYRAAAACLSGLA